MLKSQMQTKPALSRVRGFCSSAVLQNGGYKRRVAVIGGGITGLTTAFRAASDPKTHVTLYEKQPRLGGWLQSEYLDVDGKKILFEYGPKTFRLGVDSAATIELIHELNMENEMRFMKGSGKKYIFDRDHLELLPGPELGVLPSVSLILKSPYLRSILGSVLHKRFVEGVTPSPGEESAGSFLERYYGKTFVEDFASAIAHGIYAGDIYQLDARTALSAMKSSEGLKRMEKFKLFMRKCLGLKELSGAAAFHAMTFLGRPNGKEKLSKYLTIADNKNAMFVLNRGMGSLAQALAKRLESSPNVTLLLNTEVTSITGPIQDGPLKITLRQGFPKSFDLICSATSSSVLSRQLQSTIAQNDFSIRGYYDGKFVESDNCFDSLNESVNVMVVNLYYRTRNLTPDGFGYLIPNSVPLSANPERALGVVFPLPKEADQDECSQGTKISVMMGGHWWSGWDRQDIPSEAEAVEMAKSLLKRHLHITEEPAVAKARLQLNCIPQTQNALKALLTLDMTLDSLFHNRLKLAGPSYGGVSLNDCIRDGLLRGIQLRSSPETKKDMLKRMSEYMRRRA